MNDNIIEKVRKFVYDECRKPTSKYGFEPFEYHFAVVAKYAEQLSNELGGDKEVILISAWIHGIGSIVHGRDNHHITGVKIAENFLRKQNYPLEKIELVKRCIANHRGSVPSERTSIEEQIVCEADVLSAFDDLSGIFKAALVYEKLDQGQAKISVRKKFQNKFKQLHFEKSIKIIKPKYDAAMILLAD